MSEQRNYNSFQELLKNNSYTENLDLVSEASPASNPGNNPPNIPFKVKTLETKVAGLERDMTWVKQNMATKQDIAELKNLIQNR